MENKQGVLTRRDFLKLVSAGTLGVLSGWPLHLAGADGLVNPETDKIENNQWFYSAATSLILVPIRKDWSYDDTGSMQRSPVKIRLNDKVMLQARNVRNFQLNGSNVRVGEVPFAGGFFPGVPGISPSADQYMGVAILELNNNKYYEVADNSEGEILGGFTGIWEESLSPLGTWNILEAAKNLLAFQAVNGGFPDGDYSFLKIQKLSADNPGFKMNPGGFLAPGVGACASILSKSLYPLVQKEKAEYLERDLHPTNMQYFGGPSAPEITEENSDATVEIDDDRLGRRDFSWRLKGLGKTYLFVDALIIPNLNAWRADKKWTDFPSDTRLIFTMTWRRTLPTGGSVEKISKLQDLYGFYRESSGSAARHLLLEGGFETNVSWGDIRPIVEIAYPEFTTKDFQFEINGSDSRASLQNIKNFLTEQSGKTMETIGKSELTRFYCSLIYYLAGAVSDYNKRYPFSEDDAKSGKKKPDARLGTFLSKKMQEDGIYENLTSALYGGVKEAELSPLEKGLFDLNDNTYLVPGQSIQCVGWVSFLGRLGLPISPTYIGGANTSSASGLLKDEGREVLKWSDIWADGEFLFAKVESVDKVQIGDSFVRYAGNNKNHIGTVIGKKIIKGETVLLITDANRKSDGVIRVFEVNKTNFRVIFGEGALTPPVVIRNKKVQDYLASWDNPISFWLGR